MESKNRAKLLVSVLAIVIAFAVFIKPLVSTVKQGLDLQGPSTGPSRSSAAGSTNWA